MLSGGLRDLDKVLAIQDRRIDVIDRLMTALSLEIAPTLRDSLLSDERVDSAIVLEIMQHLDQMRREPLSDSLLKLIR